MRVLNWTQHLLKELFKRDFESSIEVFLKGLLKGKGLRDFPGNYSTGRLSKCPLVKGLKDF